MRKEKTSASERPFSISKARKAQTLLAQRLIIEDVLPEKIQYVAGVDVAYLDNRAIGIAVVLDYSTQGLVEFQKTICKTSIPYISTLLSFREIPPAVTSIRKLSFQPDLLMVDGQGLAHPYRCGFASHLGIVIGKPTIGVAKSRLIGKIVKNQAAGIDSLVDSGEIIGAVLESQKGTRPLYVSVGHMISLATAVEIVKNCTRYRRIPEPLLKAHQLATVEKRKITNLTSCNK